MSRYERVRGHKGIKKDLSNGKYLAIKYVNGKEFSKKFDSLKKAINWRATFHPAAPKILMEKSVEDDSFPVQPRRINIKLNGEDLGYTFKNVWELYKEIYLPSLEKSSMDHRLSKVSFYMPLMNFKMVEITASLIDNVVSEHKKNAKKRKSKRFNFNDDLKCLKALFNWYRENYDPLFVNPILRRHKLAGVIKKAPVKNKKLKPEHLISFFKHLSPFWRDFAETQFYMGARVSEVAGLQDNCVDLSEQQIRIQFVASWSYKNKKFDYLKEKPKNGETSYVSMNRKLKEIMERRLPLASNGFVFHFEGNPINYRQVQYHYNFALKKAGLSHLYSSTHIMRHSMGTITRKVTGSADKAQAVTRHKDIQIAQQYASLPTEANKEAVNEVHEYLNELENGGGSNPPPSLNENVLRLVRKNS